MYKNQETMDDLLLKVIEATQSYVLAKELFNEVNNNIIEIARHGLTYVNIEFIQTIDIDTYRIRYFPSAKFKLDDEEVSYPCVRIYYSPEKFNNYDISLIKSYFENEYTLRGFILTVPQAANNIAISWLNAFEWVFSSDEEESEDKSDIEKNGI